MNLCGETSTDHYITGPGDPSSEALPYSISVVILTCTETEIVHLVNEHCFNAGPL